MQIKSVSIRRTYISLTSLGTQASALTFNSCVRTSVYKTNEKLKQNSPLGRSLTPENTKYLKQIPLEKQYTALKYARLIAAFAYRNVEWNPFQQEIINYSDSGRDGSTLNWYYDRKGNVGKSYVAKYLQANEEAYCPQDGRPQGWVWVRGTLGGL